MSAFSFDPIQDAATIVMLMVWLHNRFRKRGNANVVVVKMGTTTPTRSSRASALSFFKKAGVSAAYYGLTMIVAWSRFYRTDSMEKW